MKLSYLQAMAACCLFLAAKVEEQPRKLEHVIKVQHTCLHRDAPSLDTRQDVSLITISLCRWLCFFFIDV